MPLKQLNLMFCLRHTSELDKAIIGGGLDIWLNKTTCLKILIPIDIVSKCDHLC